VAWIQHRAGYELRPVAGVSLTRSATRLRGGSTARESVTTIEELAEVLYVDQLSTDIVS